MELKVKKALEVTNKLAQIYVCLDKINVEKLEIEKLLEEIRGNFSRELKE